jgi:tetratricopeptide (TPR) repeat protein
MSLLRSLQPYHYGERRWDNYLLDLHESLDANAGTSQQILQAQEHAAEIYREQADELQQQTIELEAIRDSLDEIEADLRWGFNVVVDRLDRQIAVFSEAVKALDAIHKTLQSPLMTQAKELFDWGEDRFHKGLYDKALDAFLQSEQKNEVNFLLQLRIGTLFLEGRNHDCNVIDLPSAEKHLVLADRYAQAEAKTVPHWREFSGEARYRAGIAAYLTGEQKQQAGDSDAMRACLERAVEHFQRSFQFRDDNRTIYSQAKCQALLGQKQEALSLFEILSDRNRKYLAEVQHDPDFDSIRNDIEQVFKRAVENPGPLARNAGAKLDDADKFLAWAKQAVSNSSQPEVTAFERRLSEARRLLGSVDVKIESLSSDLIRVLQEIVKFTEDDLRDQVGVINSQKKIKEDGLRDKVRSIQSQIAERKFAIQDLEKRMKEPSDSLFCSVIGITLGALAFWAAFGLLMVIPMYLASLANNDESPFGLLVFPFFAAAIGVAWFIGTVVKKIFRNRKNRPLQLERDAITRQVEGGGGSALSLTQELAVVEQRLQEFLSGQQLSPAEQHLEEFWAWRKTLPETDPRAR